LPSSSLRKQKFHLKHCACLAKYTALHPEDFNIHAIIVLLGIVYLKLFGDWSLSMSAAKNLLSSAQAIELVPETGTETESSV
jgi:hypothetical protein